MPVRVLDLFCGGGGSSWGARKAGARISCGLDLWDVAIRTYNDNFDGCGLNQTISGQGRLPALERFGGFDMILASPECTNHTCARGNRERDEASRLTARHVLRYARKFLPRWMVIENVIHMKSWSRYTELIEELKKGLGYHVRIQVLDAADFGVPQNRKRLFILCDRAAPPDEVQPTSLKVTPAASILDPPGTWGTRPLYQKGRAKNTLARAERAMAALPPGTPFLLVYYGSDAAGGWQTLDRPLRTLTTLDRFGLVEHSPEGPTLRMLQPSELRRAMGFDPEYLLRHGSRRDRIRMLGNGVCPPVMEAVVRSLINRS